MQLPTGELELEDHAPTVNTGEDGDVERSVKIKPPAADKPLGVRASADALPPNPNDMTSTLQPESLPSASTGEVAAVYILRSEAVGRATAEAIEDLDVLISEMWTLGRDHERKRRDPKRCGSSQPCAVSSCRSRGPARRT